MLILVVLVAAVVGRPGSCMSLADYASSARSLAWPSHPSPTWPSTRSANDTPSVIEGDVTLMRGEQWRPMMVDGHDGATTRRRHAGVTFKDWLYTVASTHKALKINMVNSGVVKPALKEMYAAKAAITSPVIIHADIWRGTNSNDHRATVNGDRFVREVARHFPSATVSVGSTSMASGEGITWRMLFDRLTDMVDVHQHLVMVVDASVAQHSVEQLLWYLGIRPSLTLLVRSRPDDDIEKWLQLVRLRENDVRRKIIFELADEHADMLEQLGARYGEQLTEGVSKWTESEWRVVAFMPSTRHLSGIVTGTFGPAFLGSPHSFLLSERRVEGAARPQVVSGHVHFVPRDNLYMVNAVARSGLAVHLKDSVASVPSADIHGGIVVFIGHTGMLSIENAQFLWDSTNTNDGGGALQRSVSTALPSHACYSFAVEDANTRVSLHVRAVPCRGEAGVVPSAGDYSTVISLRTPRRVTQRHVIVKKVGEPLVDVWVDGLAHSACHRLFTNFLLISLSILLSLLLSTAQHL